MNWGKFFKELAKGAATAATMGAIGRGKKTQQAGQAASAVIELAEECNTTTLVCPNCGTIIHSRGEADGPVSNS